MNKQQKYLKKKYYKYGYNKRRDYCLGFWYDEERDLFIKFNRSEYSTSTKKFSNRKVRYCKKEISNYSGYRKVGVHWLWLF